MESARPTSNTPPSVATILTWLLPGAGHAALGLWPIALLGFVLVEGLYLLGYLLSDGVVFEFLDPELRGRFALVLTPEFGNLGALLFHQLAVPLTLPAGLGPIAPPLPPNGVHLGAVLTACSGVLNMVLMCHAHLTALARKHGQSASRTAEPDGASSPQRAVDRTAVQVAAGWLIPGAGHWLQGRTRRAVLVAITLLGVFAIGTFLAEGTNLSREHHFYYWSGQALVGLPAFLAEALRGHPDLASVPSMLDAGLFFGALAGLLNGLVLIDVYAWGEAGALGRDPVEDRRAVAAHRRESKSTAKKRSGGARSDGNGPASKHLVAPHPAKPSPAGKQGDTSSDAPTSARSDEDPEGIR